jgi:uncharacterized protein (TIRG00374 family)
MIVQDIEDKNKEPLAQDKKTLFARLKKKLIFSIILGALVFLGYSLYADFDNVINASRQFSWRYIFLLILLATINYAFRFLKWHYYLYTLDIKLPAFKSAIVFFSGLTLAITPGRFGEVLKSYFVKELNGCPVRKSAPIVLAERFTDFIALVILALSGIFVFKQAAGLYILSIGIIVAVLVLVASKNLFLKILSFFDHFSIIRNNISRVEALYMSMSQLVNPVPLLCTTILSVVSWSFECTAFYLVFKGFHENFSISSAFFIYCISTIVGAISMLPGGLIFTEGSMVGWLNKWSGIEQGRAVIITFIIRVSTLWYAVILGIITLTLFKKYFYGKESA